MSFNWSTYLDLAQELTMQAPTSLYQEAKLRSAISRAYYAAFCKARNHLRDIDALQVPHDGSAHRFVKEQFKNNTLKERKKRCHPESCVRERRMETSVADLWARTDRKLSD